MVKSRRAAYGVVVTLGFLIGGVCSGCKKSVAVPNDCQVFLDKYFDAVKSKNVERLQEFSSYISRAQSQGIDDQGLALMRESKRKFAAEGFERVSKDFGDFERYSVLSVKETTITAEELAAKNMQGVGLQGIHTDVVCKAKFSKKSSALVALKLFKETPESEYSLEAWQYQAEP